MKTKYILLALAVSSVWLQASTQESYDFLRKMMHLEQKFIAFSNHYFLSERFRGKSIYSLKTKKDLKEYEASMRQMVIDINGATHHRLLTRFIDAKNLMSDLRAERNATNSRTNLLKMSLELNKEVEKASKLREASLSPSIRALYALSKVQMLLATLNQRYLVYTDQKAPGSAQDEMKDLVKKVEENLAIYGREPYKQSEEIVEFDRAMQTWTALKEYLEKPGLAMVVDVGVTHMDLLVGRLIDIRLKSW